MIIMPYTMDAPCSRCRHSQTQLLVINKRLPGQQLPQLFVIPRPTKQQLENAVRKAQEQLHNQGLSVTLGSLDCALAQAFGLTGSLSDLGYQPRDLGPIQVRLCLGSICAWAVLLSMYATRK